jgi:hypothetical protein
LDLWAFAHGVTVDFSRPGKPTDNAFIEAFNGRLRAGLLNAPWFLTLAAAAEKLKGWRRDYNEVQPHRAIGKKTPIALMNPGDATSPSVTLTRAGKLQHRVLQRIGADHGAGKLRDRMLRRMGLGQKTPELRSLLNEKAQSDQFIIQPR